MEQSRDCFEVNEVGQALHYRFAVRGEELNKLIAEVGQHLGADVDNPSCRLLIRSAAEIVGTRYAFIKRENEELKSKLETAYLTVRQAYEMGLSMRTERPVPQPLKWFETENENWAAMLPVVLAHRGDQRCYWRLFAGTDGMWHADHDFPGIHRDEQWESLDEAKEAVEKVHASIFGDFTEEDAR